MYFIWDNRKGFPIASKIAKFHDNMADAIIEWKGIRKEDKPYYEVWLDTSVQTVCIGVPKCS